MQNDLNDLVTFQKQTCMKTQTQTTCELHDRKNLNAHHSGSLFQQGMGSQRSVDRLRNKAFPSRLGVGWVWGVKKPPGGEKPCPTHPPLKCKRRWNKHLEVHTPQMVQVEFCVLWHCTKTDKKQVSQTSQRSLTSLSQTKTRSTRTACAGRRRCTQERANRHETSARTRKGEDGGTPPVNLKEIKTYH